MKRLFRFILVVVLGINSVSCKKTNKVDTTLSNIAFTKQGTAQLFKQDTDSLISSFDIEFAKTAYETQTGLMYRNSMAKNQAMLFIFEDESPRYFYMKNTRIPLDIIYLSKDLIIVSFQTNAIPFDTNSLPSNAPAQYVLEINAGLVDALGIEVNDRLEFKTLKK